ncbi:MAG: tetratricopeptide repeat protein [bacterium]
MTKLLRHAAALVVMASALIACAEGAERRVVVFDFTPRQAKGYEWVGPALAEYVIALLRGAEGFSAVERAVVVRRLARLGYPPYTASPLEVKDRIREELGAGVIVEGDYDADRSSLRFRGSIIDMETGELVSNLQFRLSPFTVFDAQRELRSRLEKELGRKLKNDMRELLGTGSKEAYTEFCMGRALYESGSGAEAGASLEKAAGADPSYVAPLLLLGRINLEETRFETALKHLQKAVGEAPENPEAHFLLGYTMFFLRVLDGAQEHLRAAVRLKGAEPDYHYVSGMVHFENGELESALGEFRRVVELDPGFAEGWYKIAVVHSHRMEEEGVRSALEKAIETGGKDVQVRLEKDRDFDWLRDRTWFKALMRRRLR